MDRLLEIKVKPKKWWNLRKRKQAKLAEKLLNKIWSDILNT